MAHQDRSQQLNISFYNQQCNKESLTSVENDDGDMQQQQCPYFLPYEEQGWPSYMGIQGDSKYNIKAEMKERQRIDTKNHGR